MDNTKVFSVLPYKKKGWYIELEPHNNNDFKILSRRSKIYTLKAQDDDISLEKFKGSYHHKIFVYLETNRKGWIAAAGIQYRDRGQRDE